MPEVDRHIQQWLHNRGFISAVPAAYGDWMITATFYTALHAVDALLAHDHVRGVVDHSSRNAVLGETRRYQQINKNYKPLYMLSRTVRYFAEPAKWVPTSEIDPKVLRGLLYPIEQSVQKLMSRNLDLTPVVLRTS